LRIASLLANEHFFIASSLGEDAAAGQECPAYRIFEIAAFISAHRGAFSSIFARGGAYLPVGRDNLEIFSVIRR